MGEPDAKQAMLEGMSQMLGEGDDFGDIQKALPQMQAFLERYAAPDFECVMGGLPPTPPITYPGIEGVARAWSDFGAAFESVRADLKEVRESDDHVVLFADQVVVTRHGGVEMSQPSAMVWGFDGPRVTRLEFHLDRAQALERAGMDPGD
jgi:ketosteroid isomerase-like protein